mgnify:FL=1
MASLKSLRNSTTTKSVLEKLKSLSNRTVSDAKNPLDGLSPPKSSESLFNDSTFVDSPNNMWDTVLKIIRYFFAFLLFAFILLNILASLGLLPNFLAELFRPILVFFGYNIGETIRQTIDVADQGIKSTSSAITNTVDSAVNLIEEQSKLNPNSAIKVLDDATNKYNKPDLDEPEPIETDSRTQSSGSKKAGFCYIGEDRGIRSCIEIGVNDECMSGDIFPTDAICINPNLRS